jgi:hypothetical protein
MRVANHPCGELSALDLLRSGQDGNDLQRLVHE